jgi:hypothetical protein
MSGVHSAAPAPAAAAAVGPPWLRLVVCAGPAAGQQFEAHTNRQEVRWEGLGVGKGVRQTR